MMSVPLDPLLGERRLVSPPGADAWATCCYRGYLGTWRITDSRLFLRSGALAVRATPTGESHAGSEGKLTFIDNTVDQQTGTIRLRATFPNRDNVLWPGQFANVTVTLDQQDNAIVIPADAFDILDDNGR